ncbi:MAG: hypothetical protein AAF586_06330 [Planctomycetota bacterium]
MNPARETRMNRALPALLAAAALLAPPALTGCVIEEEVEEYPAFEETRDEEYPAFENTDFQNDGSLDGP